MMQDGRTNTETENNNQPDTGTELDNQDVEQEEVVLVHPNLGNLTITTKQSNTVNSKMNQVVAPEKPIDYISVNVFDRILLYWDTIKKLIPMLPFIKQALEQLTKIKESIMNNDTKTTTFGIVKLAITVLLGVGVYFGFGVDPNLLQQVSGATDWGALIIIIKAIVSFVIDYFTNKKEKQAAAATTN